MGRLRVLSGREVCTIRESQGFAVVRQRGSHIVVQKRLDATTVTVPVPEPVEVVQGRQLTPVHQRTKLRE